MLKFILLAFICFAAWIAIGFISWVVCLYLGYRYDLDFVPEIIDDNAKELFLFGPISIFLLVYALGCVVQGKIHKRCGPNPIKRIQNKVEYIAICKKTIKDTHPNHISRR